MPQKSKHRLGPQSSYKPEYAGQAERLCMLGFTDPQLCAFFECGHQTLQNWRAKHRDFAAATRRGKAQADANVAASLYQRACGYRHIAFKIFQHEGRVITKRYVERFPPDTVACLAWLQNRQPELWRDRRAIELTGKGGKELALTDDHAAARRIAYMLAAADAGDRAKERREKANGHGPH